MNNPDPESNNLDAEINNLKLIAPMSLEGLQEASDMFMRRLADELRVPEKLLTPRPKWYYEHLASLRSDQHSRALRQDHKAESEQEE